MAIVNLLSNSWSSSTTTSNIKVTVDVDTSRFACSTSVAGYAKIYIPISDISKYNSITFKYNKFAYTGSYSWVVGVFDDADASTRVGDVVINDFSTSGGTITFDVSSLSGTKYVGFRFAAYAGASSSDPSYASMWMTSLTAVERGYTLTYNANGGSGAPSSVSDITSTTISSTVPTRSGYDFLGWSTSSTATYATYTVGDTISLSSNIMLYAVWQKFYTITYNANGGSNAPSADKKIDGQTIVISGTSPTPPANVSVTYSVTLNANGGVCDQDMLTVTNVTTYEFLNWNTEPDGSGVMYQSYELYANNSDITLYAQYESTIAYNSIFLPTPTRNGYKFLGWAENKSDPSGTAGEYTPTGNITLYATWKRMGNVYIYDGTGGFNPYQVFIYDGSGWNQYIPYIYTDAGWEEYSG